MKKEVTINSSRPEIMTAAVALNLKDCFMDLGFSSRSSFVEIVCDYLPKYKDQLGIAKLQRFWNMRLGDAMVNSDIELVLNKLKNE